MRGFGILLMIAGTALALLGLFSEPTTGYRSSTVNLHMLHVLGGLVVAGGGLFVSGAVMFAAGELKQTLRPAPAPEAEPSPAQAEAERERDIADSRAYLG